MTIFSLLLSYTVFIAFGNCVASTTFPQSNIGLNSTLAPLYVPGTSSHSHIKNSYIVVLRDNYTNVDLDKHLYALHSFLALTPEMDTTVTHVWDSILISYSGIFSPGALDFVRQRPEVKYMEQNQPVHMQKTCNQTGPPWGLAQISHREKMNLTEKLTYEYHIQGGRGVDVYVVDMGINIDHVEFGGCATWGTTIKADTPSKDQNGHGTHVAGIIASRKYGVAKVANVIAVKVFGADGSGGISDIVSGITWAVLAAQQKCTQALAELERTGQTTHKGSIINLSLAVKGNSKFLNEYINRVVNTTSTHFVIAAGNSNIDACNISPASAELPLTVGASAVTDQRAVFSNYGKCVDIFTPGMDIVSTFIGGLKADHVTSGTSQAAPHIASIAAYLLSAYPSPAFDQPISQRNCDNNITRQRCSTFLMAIFSDSLEGFLPQLPLRLATLFSIGDDLNVPRQNPSDLLSSLHPHS